MFGYYSMMDYSHWLKKINFDATKVETLKTPQGRSGYLLELYSTYLQLIEVLLTNIRIASAREMEFLDTLFISNEELHKYFKHATEDPKFYPWFMNDIVFGINEKNKISDFKKKVSEHTEVLKEAIKDFLEDYHFLNAYKHGYRVKSISNKHALSYITPEGKRFELDKYDSLLIYYSRESSKEELVKFIIYEKMIAFKVRRVVLKAQFLTAMLESIKILMTAELKNNKITIEYPYFVNKDEWLKSYGTFRMKQEVFKILK